jgi:hypothetical protein
MRADPRLSAHESSGPAAMGRGLGDADFAALIEVLEGAAGTKL